MPTPQICSAGASPLPLKNGVGIVLVNDRGHVWIGLKRPKWAGVGHPGHWQMPQGGLLKGEDVLSAALRELEEETGITSIEVLGVSAAWRTWELPADLVGIALKGRYRGQHQLWYAIRFTGSDAEIDITGRGGAIKPEFSAWRWAAPRDAVMDTAPFRQHLYTDVFAEFAAVMGAPADMALA